MKQGEIREINGYFVRKSVHPTFRNRDGYAKSCYFVYENEEDAIYCGNNRIAVAYTMKEVKDITKN